MSNRRGRCFRQQRRTRRRKERQAAAFAALKKAAPHLSGERVNVFVPFGKSLGKLTVDDLNPRQKQQLVQGYKKFMSAPVRLRRAARGT